MKICKIIKTLWNFQKGSFGVPAVHFLFLRNLFWIGTFESTSAFTKVKLSWWPTAKFHLTAETSSKQGKIVHKKQIPGDSSRDLFIPYLEVT